MGAERDSVGRRRAYRFSVGDDGMFRLHLYVGGQEMELLILGDGDVPHRGAPPRSGVFRRPGARSFAARPARLRREACYRRAT